MSNHLSASDRRALLRHLYMLAEKLGLRDWEIEVGDDPCPDDALAMVTTIYGRKFATVSVGKDFRSRTPQSQRHIVTHELLHLHFEPMFHAVYRFSNDSYSISSEISNLLDTTMRNGLEYGIDGLAVALAPKYSLIDWPKPKQKPEPEPEIEPAAKKPTKKAPK